MMAALPDGSLVTVDSGGQVCVRACRLEAFVSLCLCLRVYACELRALVTLRVHVHACVPPDVSALVVRAML